MHVHIYPHAWGWGERKCCSANGHSWFGLLRSILSLKLEKSNKILKIIQLIWSICQFWKSQLKCSKAKLSFHNLMGLMTKAVIQVSQEGVPQPLSWYTKVLYSGLIWKETGPHRHWKHSFKSCQCLIRSRWGDIGATSDIILEPICI